MDSNSLFHQIHLIHLIYLIHLIHLIYLIYPNANIAIAMHLIYQPIAQIKHVGFLDAMYAHLVQITGAKIAENQM